jgi:hypothetical protein
MSELTQMQAQKLLKGLRKAFADRPHTRKGIYTYLQPVYRAVRVHRKKPAFLDAVGVPDSSRETSSLFVRTIAATSDVTPKMRSKYATVMTNADKARTHWSEFISFIEESGGLNAAAEKRKSWTQKKAVRIRIRTASKICDRLKVRRS